MKIQPQGSYKSRLFYAGFCCGDLCRKDSELEQMLMWWQAVASRHRGTTIPKLIVTHLT